MCVDGGSLGAWKRPSSLIRILKEASSAAGNPCSRMGSLEEFGVRRHPETSGNPRKPSETLGNPCRSAPETPEGTRPTRPMGKPWLLRETPQGRYPPPIWRPRQPKQKAMDRHPLPTASLRSRPGQGPGWKATQKLASISIQEPQETIGNPRNPWKPLPEVAGTPDGTRPARRGRNPGVCVESYLEPRLRRLSETMESPDTLWATWKPSAEAHWNPSQCEARSA